MATASDNAELCALCQIPSGGNIQFTIERSPDFFTVSKMQCEQTEIYVCRNKNSNNIEGVFSVGKRSVFYHGQIKQVRYFSDMRILAQSQGSRLLFQVVRFMTDQVLVQDEIAQAIVFADNKVMLELIHKLQHRSAKMSIFNFYSAGNYVSHMVKFSGAISKKSVGYQIRKAITNDIDQMQEFMLKVGPKKEFFPYYNFKALGSDYYANLSIENFYLAFDNEKLVGMAGTWDQHSMKQTKIYGYSLPYKILRPFINLYGLLSSGFTLPAEGTVLKYLTIHSIWIHENNNEVFESILLEINQDYNNNSFDYFLVGLNEKDTLNKSLSVFRNKRIIKGRHFLITKNNKPDQEMLEASYYLEAARI